MSILDWVAAISLTLCTLFAIVCMIRAHTEERISKARAEAFHNGYDCGYAACRGYRLPRDQRARPPLLPLDSWEATERAARKEKP